LFQFAGQVIDVGEAGAIGINDPFGPAQFVVVGAAGLGRVAGAGRRRGDTRHLVGTIEGIRRCPVAGVGDGQLAAMGIVGVGVLGQLTARGFLLRDRKMGIGADGWRNWGAICQMLILDPID